MKIPNARRSRAHLASAFVLPLAALGGLAGQGCSSADDIPPYDDLPDAGRPMEAGGSDATPTTRDAGSSTDAPDSAATTDADASDSSSTSGDAMNDAPPPVDLDSGAADANYIEAPMTIAIALGVRLAADAGFDDAGNPLDGGAPIATLTITARDGTTPLYTDLWLYTIDPNGQRLPLSGFTSTAGRKSPRLMMPATIGGEPSGLTPADDGDLNGVMTSTSRGVLDQGAFVPTMNGTVVVTLPSPPTMPILVVGGVEDQRYAGAAVINPDATPGVVPAGVGAVETHRLRSFDLEVKPILRKQCAACHDPTDEYAGNEYLVTGSREDLVNDNFALTEQTVKCATANPDGSQALAACIQAITSAQFLVEPGAPAASDLLQRSRPDENAGTSTLGLAWYGSKGSRYNATYGDRRMPSTAETADAGAWTNEPTPFDQSPSDFQVLYDWVAQGARP